MQPLCFYFFSRSLSHVSLRSHFTNLRFVLKQLLNPKLFVAKCIVPILALFRNSVSFSQIDVYETWVIVMHVLN